MSRNFLAFDIETAKDVPGDFADWRKHRPLGICCAAMVVGDSDEARAVRGSHDPAPGADLRSPKTVDVLTDFGDLRSGFRRGRETCAERENPKAECRFLNVFVDSCGII